MMKIEKWRTLSNTACETKITQATPGKGSSERKFEEPTYCIINIVVVRFINISLKVFHSILSRKTDQIVTLGPMT